MSKTWYLGITGGIGSGKTTVANLFSHYNIEIIDADQIARDIVKPNTPALIEITQHFGEAILLKNGQLNRAQLRKVIFDDPKQRHWVEQLLHPLIRQKISQRLDNANSPYAILVSPLLFESNQYQLVDRILVVDVPESLQIARAMERDHNTQEQIEAIIHSQLPRNERLKYADDIIVNDKDIHHLQQEVKRLHKFYLTLKGGKHE